MHSAPSVVYPVGRCAFQAWLLVALGGVTAVVGVVFVIGSNFSNQGVWGWFFGSSFVLAWLAWAAWACGNWYHSPEGTLKWESEGGSNSINGVWTWSGGTVTEPAVPCGVERVLDLQCRILLRIREPGGVQHWIWVERDTSPARWSDLRRALVSSRA